MNIKDRYRTACGFECVIMGTVEIPKDVKYHIPYRTLYEGAVCSDDTEWVWLYDPTGRAYHPDDFEPMTQDDPIALVGIWKDPETRYFLRGKDGSYYGPNSSPVSYTDLNTAQEKCATLEWLYHPIAFLEQDGVR